MAIDVAIQALGLPSPTIPTDRHPDHNTGHHEKRDGVTTQPERLIVILPNLFQSFLKQTPNVNPHYELARKESEEWLNRFCSFSPKLAAKVHRCDFSYFCAITAPSASYERFKTLCDWGNWVFPYDDMFDNGSLRSDTKTASLVMESLLAALYGQPFEGDKLPVVQAHDDIFYRISEETSDGTRKRFANAIRAYCYGALVHVKANEASRLPTLEEMIQTRRQSAGVSPLYHLVEYAHQLHIPDEVFEHPIIRKLEELGMDMVSISNDILSYLKEETEGVPHNMVAVCRMRGMSAQRAFDTVGNLLTIRYHEWDITMANLPLWGPQVDVDVRKYIQGIQNVVRANINWSFKSQRYLGKNAAEIRCTRQISVMKKPSYLGVFNCA